MADMERLIDDVEMPGYQAKRIPISSVLLKRLVAARSSRSRKG